MAAALDQGAYGEAYTQFRVASAQGHAPAQFLLALMYFTGQVVAKDDAVRTD